MGRSGSGSVRKLLEAGHVVLGVLPVAGVLRLLPCVVAVGCAAVERRARRVAGVASPWSGEELTAVLPVLAWMGHRSGRVRNGGTGEPEDQQAREHRADEQTSHPSVSLVVLDEHRARSLGVLRASRRSG